MYAAVVTDTSQAPRYAEFADPVVGPGRVEAEVLASAVHVIVRTIAAGRHYSAPRSRPSSPASTASSGCPTAAARTPAGPAAVRDARRARLAAAAGVDVPEGLSSATAAALVNPAARRGSRSAASRRGRHGADHRRHRHLRAARGPGGQALGAGPVVALGRNAEALARPPRWARTPPSGSTTTSRPRWPRPPARDGAYDIVLDYLGGAPAPPSLQALVANKVAPHRPVRFVNIGNLAGPELPWPAAMRSTAIQVPATASATPDGADGAGRGVDVRRGGGGQALRRLRRAPAQRGRVPLGPAGTPRPGPLIPRAPRHVSPWSPRGRPGLTPSERWDLERPPRSGGPGSCSCAR